MKRKLRQNILAGDGTTYTLAVGIVRSRLPDGTPRYVEFISMDETVDLTSPANREFVTAYLPKDVMRTPPAPGVINGNT